MTAVVELAQPRKLLPRWPGHGDLTIVVDGPFTYLRADQVEQLAGVPPWGDGETVLGDEWPLDVDGIPFYTLNDAKAKCARRGTTRAADFVAWLDDFLRGVDDDALELAHRIVPFTEAHTVTAVARLLDGDARISMGRDRLFAVMDGLGWIHRNSSEQDWIITPHAHVRDLLTLRPVIVRRRRYLQIHVTKTGLATLHTHLLTPATETTTARPPSSPLF